MANLCCKGPDSKYFPPWLAIQPLLQILGSAGMKAGTDDAQEWLGANKTLFAKTGAWLILARVLLYKDNTFKAIKAKDALQ